MRALALFLAWLSFSSPIAPMFQHWRGVVPPFVGVPATLFGLLMTFLSQDVWDVNRRAYREVAQEREQLTTLIALTEGHAIDAADVPRAYQGANAAQNAKADVEKFASALGFSLTFS